MSQINHVYIIQLFLILKRINFLFEKYKWRKFKIIIKI